MLSRRSRRRARRSTSGRRTSSLTMRRSGRSHHGALERRGRGRNAARRRRLPSRKNSTGNGRDDLRTRVLVSGRDAQRGEAVVSAIRANGGEADFLQADLRDGASARDLARRAVDIAGHVDILVNNAGIYPFGPTAETSEEAFDAVYATNVKAPFVLVGELAPRMAARGKGAIVNVSTMVADFGQSGMALYGSSKAAINLLTKAWAAEFGPRGVRVNAVSPGRRKLKERRRWPTVSRNLRRSPRRGIPRRRSRSPTRSSTWLRRTRASCTARSCRLMVAEPPSDSRRRRPAYPPAPSPRLLDHALQRRALREQRRIGR